jgi:3-phenylpropionate/trans-cinnamate dioxygenase ferredoxin reductase subunit
MSRSAGVVLVGGGIAAVSAVRTLRSAAYDGPVVLLSDERVAPYDRPPLSKQYLAGALGEHELALFRPGEADELSVTVRLGTPVRGLDVAGRTVLLDEGEVPYDAVLVATGATARRLAAPDLPGALHLRSRDDAAALAPLLGTAGSLVVVGAGFIGLEVAATARTAGAAVTVLEAAPAPLTRVLGPEAGEVVAALHREQGVDLRFGVELLGATRGPDGTRVRYRQDGAEHQVLADAVVVGVGAAPATGWLAEAAVEIDDGVVCDASGRTSAPGVYAAGDVSRWRNALTGATRRVEQWQSAQEQGAVVGTTIAADLGVPGAQAVEWSSVPYFWSDQYHHKLQFCGAPAALSHARQTARGWVSVYAAGEDGPLTGVLALDGPVALARGRRLVAAGTPWPEAVAWLEQL